MTLEGCLTVTLSNSVLTTLPKASLHNVQTCVWEEALEWTYCSSVVRRLGARTFKFNNGLLMIRSDKAFTLNVVGVGFPLRFLDKLISLLFEGPSKTTDICTANSPSTPPKAFGKNRGGGGSDDELESLASATTAVSVPRYRRRGVGEEGDSLLSVVDSTTSLCSEVLTVQTAYVASAVSSVLFIKSGLASSVNNDNDVDDLVDLFPEGDVFSLSIATSRLTTTTAAECIKGFHFDREEEGHPAAHWSFSLVELSGVVLTSSSRYEALLKQALSDRERFEAKRKLWWSDHGCVAKTEGQAVQAWIALEEEEEEHFIEFETIVEENCLEYTEEEEAEACYESQAFRSEAVSKCSAATLKLFSSCLHTEGGEGFDLDIVLQHLQPSLVSVTSIVDVRDSFASFASHASSLVPIAHSRALSSNHNNGIGCVYTRRFCATSVVQNSMVSTMVFERVELPSMTSDNDGAIGLTSPGIEYPLPTINKTVNVFFGERDDTSRMVLKEEEVEQEVQLQLVDPFHDEVDFLKSYIVQHDPDEAVLTLNLQVVVDQWRRWERELPRVRPFYAVKCNSDPMLLKTLAVLGAGFDCASAFEMDEVLRHTCRGPHEIVYSNPCKQNHGIWAAREKGVELTVFDSIDELYKLKTHFSSSRLLLRIKTDDADAQCPLSCKFGAPACCWRELMQTAATLDLQIVGIHFHVGSGCSRLGVFREAIQQARKAFDLALTFGHNMTLLDIGGGFPGDPLNANGRVIFEDHCREIREELDRLFPSTRDVEVIAEPGRYFAAPCCTLAVKIFARKTPTEAEVLNSSESLFQTASSSSSSSHDFSQLLSAPSCPPSPAVSRCIEAEPEEHQVPSVVCATNHLASSCSHALPFVYYINEGLYGCFNCIVYDHAQVHPEILLRTHAASDRTKVYAGECGRGGDGCFHGLASSDAEALRDSTIFGQTCDGFDCIVRSVKLPELQVGDWLVFKQMGAYTVSAASTFNGFSKPRMVYFRVA